MDLDQSGNSWQRVRTWLGPSLGWVDTLVNPSTYITSPSTYNVQPGDSVIFVNVAGSVTINLPSVKLWVNEYAYQPATGFQRVLIIKDLGHASAFPIMVNPFGTETVDLLAQPVSIIQNRFTLRLYPFNDLSGWWRG